MISQASTLSLRAWWPRSNAPLPVVEGPSGMTLLEVLVACGVLMLGLTGIAGLLAASTSLLGEASNLDRVATLLANASAEIQNRQICRLETFQAAAGLPGVRTACLGELEPRVSAINAFVSSAITSAPLLPSSSYVASRVDVPEAARYRSFLSEDRLLWRTGTAGLPVAQLTGTFAQEFQPATGWGGLLTLVDFLETPLPYTTATSCHPGSASSPNRFRGLPARLDVAIFKKPASDASSSGAVLLLTASSGMYTLTAGSSDVQSAPVSNAQDLQKRFLSGCSYVLALPPLWSAMSGALPQNAEQGLAVLDRWDGARVEDHPKGLKLKFKTYNAQKQQALFVVANADDQDVQLTQSQVASIFSGAPRVSDGLGGRTKTAGAYTVQLPTSRDLQGFMSSGGLSGSYWTSTCHSSGAMKICAGSNSIRLPADNEKVNVLLSVAISPTWYRVQSSWINTPAPSIPAMNGNVVYVTFSDQRIFEFPRNGENKLRVIAFQGLVGLESTFLTVE
jgi:hypothetical protein